MLLVEVARNIWNGESSGRTNTHIYIYDIWCVYIYNIWIVYIICIHINNTCTYGTCMIYWYTDIILQCFPPKCHRFPPCCCAHATPAAHQRPKQLVVMVDGKPMMYEIAAAGCLHWCCWVVLCDIVQKVPVVVLGFWSSCCLNHKDWKQCSCYLATS